jgi:hypothetical protein
VNFPESIDAFVDSKGGVLKTLDENHDHEIELLILEAKGCCGWERQKYMSKIGEIVFDTVVRGVKEWEEKSTLDPSEQLRGNTAYDQIHADRIKGAA